MVVKNSVIVNEIERKLELDFNKLEMIGYIKDGILWHLAIYTCNENIFIFKLHEDRYIISITKIPLISLECQKSFYSHFIFNDNVYKYFFIDRININEEKIIFIKGNEINVIKNDFEALELSETEMVILKISEEFLNKEKFMESENVSKM